MKAIQEIKDNQKKKAIKVIQFGEGNFLRAFVDWMVHKANVEGGYDGGIAVVQPLPNGLCSMLDDQNGLYTHYLSGIRDGKAIKEHYINESIELTVNPYDQYEAYLALAEIETASVIISNTTEAGIAYDDQDRLESGCQNSFPAKLTALLYRRYKWSKADISKGFIILPCELIDTNGDKLRAVVDQYCELWDLEEGFKNWLHEANQFCNTLVDRIVPGYPRDRIESITEELGYKDQLVVESEQFNLWVIEGPASIQDTFPVQREGCNVIYTEDVTPYKKRKVRILNGAHTTMVPIGYLYGIDTVRETVEDEVMGKLISKAIFDEIIPTLTLAKDELELFAGDVLERFMNPFVQHYLLSISLNSMSKYKTRVLPSLLGYVENEGELPTILSLALASTIVFYKGERDGVAIPLKDDEPILALYKDLWSTYDGSEASVERIVAGVLSYEALWTKDLTLVPHLLDQVTSYVSGILNQGMQEVVKEVIG